MSAPGRKPVLGLIGAIGAGKSLAAALLADRGGAVIDADRIGHEVLVVPEVLDRLASRWGPGVVRPDGTPDRRAIAAVVFADPGERRALEGIVFPEIEERVRRRIDAAMADGGARFVVLDAAVMLEAGWTGVCDRLLYLDAPRDVRVARLAARSGWSADDLTAREAAQWPAADKIARADAVVWNDGTPADLRTRLDRVLSGWGVPVS